MVRYQAGDVVRTRKPHPCGGDRWEIMRTGIDIRIKCLTCGRVVMLPRAKFDKSIRTVMGPGENNKKGPTDGS